MHDLLFFSYFFRKVSVLKLVFILQKQDIQTWNEHNKQTWHEDYTYFLQFYMTTTTQCENNWKKIANNNNKYQDILMLIDFSPIFNLINI